jgi:hypothetical protein
MARHRRHKQDPGVLVAAFGRQIAFEMQELAERALPENLFTHRTAGATDQCIFKTKGRLAVAARHALENFSTGCNLLPERRRRQGV